MKNGEKERRKEKGNKKKKEEKEKKREMKRKKEGIREVKDKKAKVETENKNPTQWNNKEQEVFCMHLMILNCIVGTKTLLLIGTLEMTVITCQIRQ